MLPQDALQVKSNHMDGSRAEYVRSSLILVTERGSKVQFNVEKVSVYENPADFWENML